MTNREKFIEVFGDNPQRHHITKSWWDEEYVSPQEPCTDAVSRQAVKDWFCTNYCSEHNECEHFENGDCNAMIELFAIPTVKPHEKTGHWIEHPTEEDYSVCSRCGIGSRRMEHGKNADGTKYIDIYSYRFCPYCGARMVEPQESEDKQ